MKIFGKSSTMCLPAPRLNTLFADQTKNETRVIIMWFQTYAEILQPFRRNLHLVHQDKAIYDTDKVWVGKRALLSWGLCNVFKRKLRRNWCKWGYVVALLTPELIAFLN